MTEVETAEAVLRDLEAKRRALANKAANLAKERQKISYAAHAGGDKKARFRLDEIIKEETRHDEETEGLEAAIVEAQTRLVDANRNAALAEDRDTALEQHRLLTRFAELAVLLDDVFADFQSASAELKQVHAAIYASGLRSPSHDQLRVFGSIALKTALLGGVKFETPSLWARELGIDLLPPNQRKTFASLVHVWCDAQLPEIERRIGADNKEEAA